MQHRHMQTVAILCALFCAAVVYGADLPVGVADPRFTTVSGLSAGGYMAVQVHVAFSSQVSGALVFAGGPYNCAQNSLTTAVTTCLTSPTSIRVDRLITDTKNFASSGKIDGWQNLADDRVYLFVGTEDKTVYPGVVQKLEDYYRSFIPTNSLVLTDYTLRCGHGIPTLDYGVLCSSSSDPYLNKCGYDGLGIGLKHLYPNLLPAVAPIATNLVSFDLTPYSPRTPSSISMDRTGYAYIPNGCKTTNSTMPCKLHLSLHGCIQNFNNVGDAYIKNTGINGYAEANNIIVVYPQTVATLGSNPNACYDWWGYVDANYPTKTGPQMQIMKNIIDRIVGTTAQTPVRVEALL
eukprot:TRINITY_DN845_c0_g1_i1.p1 TRINITY_DN845_c0_g1~~TRINITY_DN845_c0_g1_i1.p1  ORF type:complete len:349 (-),score=53.10 TRINITY_DN845_c0_g1_i1:332-1378(-)